MSKRRSRRVQQGSSARYYLAGAIVIAAVAAVVVLFSLYGHGANQAVSSSGASTTISSSKPVILYVNQGNGAVNESNFGDLLNTAVSHGFNTIFFQVYRSGDLLFTTGQMTEFVTEAHAQHLQIFFALYFTAANQTLPTSIFPDGEDGISLDMSALPSPAQTYLFGQVSTGFSGKTAITTTNPTLPLTPTFLVVETYNEPTDEQYIHPGMIAGVEVVTTTSKADYQQQVQYALANSDGVMVFDYAGLVKSGY